MSRTPRTKWIEAIRKLNGRCWFCGGDAITVDHAVPRSRGGKNTSDNLLPACQHCNNLKGDLDLEEFRVYVTQWISRTLFNMGFYRGLPTIVFYGEGNDSPLLF